MSCIGNLVNGRRCAAQGGLSSLVQLAEFSFVDLPDQEFRNDGYHVVGGLPMLVENESRASTLEVSGGALHTELDGAGAAAWSSAQATAPIASFALGDLVGPELAARGYRWPQGPWSIWWRFQSLTIPAVNGSGVRVGLRGDSGTGYNASFIGATAVRLSGAVASGVCMMGNASQKDTELEFGVPGRAEDWNVWGVRVTTDGVATAFGCAHTDGWPTLEQVIPAGFANNGSSQSAFLAFTRPGMRVGVSPVTTASVSGSPAAVLRAIRVCLG